MAKKIILSNKADDERVDILNYWKKRNKSKLYSLKLNDIFKEAILAISKNLYLGKQIEGKNPALELFEIILFFIVKNKMQIIFYRYGIADKIKTK